MGQQLWCKAGPVDRSVLMAMPVGKQLPLLGGQIVVGRETIAHHDFTQRIAQQLDRGGPRSTQTLDEHPHHGGHHAPLPAPLSGGIAAIPVAGGRAGFNRCAQDFVYDVMTGLHIRRARLTRRWNCWGPRSRRTSKGRWRCGWSTTASRPADQR